MLLLCGDTQSLDIQEGRFQSCCSSAPLLPSNTKSVGEMLHHLIQLICLPTIPPFTDYHYYMKEYDDLHSTSTYSPNRPFILLPPGSYTVPQQFFFFLFSFNFVINNTQTVQFKPNSLRRFCSKRSISSSMSSSSQLHSKSLFSYHHSYSTNLQYFLDLQPSC